MRDYVAEANKAALNPTEGGETMDPENPAAQSMSTPKKNALAATFNQLGAAKRAKRNLKSVNQRMGIRRYREIEDIKKLLCKVCAQKVDAYQRAKRTELRGLVSLLDIDNLKF